MLISYCEDEAGHHRNIGTTNGPSTSKSDSDVSLRNAHVRKQSAQVR